MDCPGITVHVLRCGGGHFHEMFDDLVRCFGVPRSSYELTPQRPNVLVQRELECRVIFVIPSNSN